MKKRQKGIRVSVAFALVAAAGLAGYAANRMADPGAPRAQDHLAGLAGVAAALAGVAAYTARRRDEEIARLSEENNRLKIESFSLENPAPEDAVLDRHLVSRQRKSAPPRWLN